jgi:putative SOS response-associated peptidase YedK
MCGRYTLACEPQLLAEYFALDQVPAALAPRFNIAPGQPVAAIRRDDRRGRRLDLLRWGLIPSWAKEPAIGNRLINARDESLADKPAFRDAFRQRRCLVAADGFYEWKRADGHKQPYWIARRDRRPFAFAGLWERWQPADGSAAITSCTIITTAADPRLRDVHDRMPAILPPEAYDAWLSAGTAAERLAALLKPFPPDAMVVQPVSSRVNNPRNDGPELLEPVEPHRSGRSG